jgi:hypothetical protein
MESSSLDAILWMYGIFDVLAAVVLQPGTTTAPSTLPLWVAIFGLLGAIAGALLTGWMSRRNQVAADKRRWGQEERVQREHWHREDKLRYHQERLVAYKGLLEKTDPTHYRRSFLILNLLKRPPEHESDTANGEYDSDTADGKYALDPTTRLLVTEVLKNEPESEMIAYRSEIELLAPAEEVQVTAKRLAEVALRYGNELVSAALEATSSEELTSETLGELHKSRSAFLEAARRDLGVQALME